MLEVRRLHAALATDAGQAAPLGARRLAVRLLAARSAAFPSPTRAEATKDPSVATRRRRLACTLTRACLETAEAEGWPAFDCLACACYQPPDDAQRARDFCGLVVASVWLDGRLVDRRRGPR